MKLIVLIVFLAVIQNPIKGAPTEQKEKVIEYLKSFGYLPENAANVTHREFRSALRRLQHFGHIEATGNVDENTLNLIKTPRCGVPDIVRVHNRQKRFDLLSAKWDQHHIKWTFDSSNGFYYSETSKIRRIITEAFSVWSASSVLTFAEVVDPETADIVISFQEVYHPEIDKYPLDSDILAHAFKPGSDIGGDVHVREDKTWDFDVMYDQEPRRNSRSFFAVVLHELGHSLGLDHSSNPKAVMYFSYSKSTGVLHDDDIRGIQHIYGVPRRQNSRPKPRPTIFTTFHSQPAPEVPDKCETSYDAISLIRGEIIIFKGTFMWRPQSGGDEIEIRAMWRDLPEDLTRIDAVYESENGEIWFFIERDIYAFDATTLLYKSSLSHLGIDHHYSKIDAIFNWHFNGKTYIFSGDQYWRLNENVVDSHYPKDISRSWREVYDIDTAFSDGERLLFFKGMSYYELNPRTMRINRMNPQSSATDFMKCTGQHREFKISNRFDDEYLDVIDDGRLADFPEDEDNIEKFEATSLNAAKTENTSDVSATLSRLRLLLLLPASLALSRAFSSIYF